GASAKVINRHARALIALVFGLGVQACRGCHKQSTSSQCVQSSDCAGGLVCVKNACTQPQTKLQLGDACSGAGECESGLVCKSGNCTHSPAQLGDPCQQQTDCDTNLVCASGMCAQPPSVRVCGPCPKSSTDQDGDCEPDALEDTNHDGTYEAD